MSFFKQNYATLIKFLLIATFYLSSCSQKEPEFNNIELVAYNWSTYNDTTRTEAPLFFKCRLYIKIDKNGNTDLYVYQSYPEPKNYFINSKTDMVLIKELLNTAKTIDTSEFMILDHQLMYDGPNLRLRIGYSKNKYKVFGFIDHDYNNKVSVFTRFYHSFDSIIAYKKYIPLKDTSNLIESKSEFIKYIIWDDTTSNPRIPLPSKILTKPVKYSPPENK